MWERGKEVLNLGIEAPKIWNHGIEAQKIWDMTNMASLIS